MARIISPSGKGGSGAPSGVYADIAALGAAYPVGNKNVYVTLDDGNWNYWNGTAWAAGGVYLSDPTVIINDLTTGGAASAASAETVKTLDGKITNLATNAATATDGQILTSNGDGTSTFVESNSDLIHVLDSAGNFTSDNVEGALAEVGTNITNIKSKFNTVLLNGFINPRASVYVEETKKPEGAIYIKIPDFGVSLPWTMYKWNHVKSSLPTYIKTSPNGVTECIEILSNQLLVIRGSAFLCRHHSEINRYTDLVIAWCFMGNLIGGLAFDALQMRLANDIDFDKSLTDGNTDCTDLAVRVMENQKSDSFTFCMVSDSHVDYVSNVMLAHSPQLSYERALHLGAYCRINLTIMGGDILINYNGTDKVQPKKILNRYISNFVGKAKSPLALTIGNHDSNSYTTTGTDTLKTRIITPQELYLLVGVHNTALTRDANNPEGIYGYYDDAASKIRFFMLNTFDFPLIEADGDSTKWKYHGDNYAGFQNAQLNWFGDSLESLPTGWAAMVFSHIPPETTIANGTRFGLAQTTYNTVPFFGIVNAYRDGTSYTASLATGDTPYDVSVDFTTRGAGEFIGFVCGHVPKDNTSNQVGGVSAPEYGYRYISIDGGIRFAVFDIDRSTKTIRVYKHGGVNIYDPAMANPPVIGLLAADVNEYGDFTTTYT